MARHLRILCRKDVRQERSSWTLKKKGVSKACCLLCLTLAFSAQVEGAPDSDSPEDPWSYLQSAESDAVGVIKALAPKDKQLVGAVADARTEAALRAARSEVEELRAKAIGELGKVRQEVALANKFSEFKSNAEMDCIDCFRYLIARTPSNQVISSDKLPSIEESKELAQESYRNLNRALQTISVKIDQADGTDSSVTVRSKDDVLFRATQPGVYFLVAGDGMHVRSSSYLRPFSDAERADGGKTGTARACKAFVETHTSMLYGDVVIMVSLGRNPPLTQAPNVIWSLIHNFGFRHRGVTKDCAYIYIGSKFHPDQSAVGVQVYSEDGAKSVEYCAGDSSLDSLLKERGIRLRGRDKERLKDIQPPIE